MPTSLPFQPAPLLPVWDIFCAVVDNFGDIGVCWRLARQLAAEYPIAPRLWIDQMSSGAGLIPGLDPLAGNQRVEGVELCRWDSVFLDVLPGEVVIAAFACTLPERFLAMMAQRSRAPVWINLEYLTAEDWIAGCHRLPSPQPRLALTQYFYFPGFDRDSGGLLRERDYALRHAAFCPETFRTALGLAPRASGELLLSLFAYENPALPGLVAAWQGGACPVTCLVPEGRVLPQLAAALGVPGLQAGARVTRGSLEVLVLPFVEQSRYDELLWACDLNFVRGEDSFVRAQWAEKPFVWQIYAQFGDAHLVKLEAFLMRRAAALLPAVASAEADFWRAWNLGKGAGAAWPAFREALQALAGQAPGWATQLQEAGELLSGLVRFCKDELE